VGVVTVSRQYAAGGSAVAERIATGLEWTLIDNRCIDLVAARLGVSPEEVAEHEERVEGLIDRLARTLAAASPETYLTATPPDATTSPELEIHRVTQAVLDEVTREGNVVLVGRGAQAFLGSRPDAVHVYVVAPREVRVASAAERLDLSPADAARRVDEVDQRRRVYVRERYGRQWDDATNYHLVVNTGALGEEGAAAVVIDAVRRLGMA